MKSNVFRTMWKIYREEKGTEAKSIEEKKHIVNTINLLLCHLEQKDIVDATVGLKIAIERLGIDDVCHICIDTEANYKVRLFYEPLGTYDGNYFFYGSECDEKESVNKEENKNV